mmetsp:Transcript_103064/g.332498  ORF Transcript_103064/g.332498 Transcript_103064/m.332498 type:complete len:141 (+) Transcript_103064:88-510(+)
MALAKPTMLKADSSFKTEITNQFAICEGVEGINSLAREWRCKWDETDGKQSLTECQKVLDEIVVPALKHVHGLSSVQRVVCGGCKDFKIIVKLGLNAFDDWAAMNFAPEEQVVEAFASIEGVSQIECQTYTIMPVTGPGK